MKRTAKLILCASALLTTLFITSCGKDDDESGPSYEFIDQNLQGTIDGQAFDFGEGEAELTTNFDEEQVLALDLFDSNEEITDICEFFGFGDQVSVFFSITPEVGLYPLSINAKSFTGLTVTLFNPDGAVNNISTEGAVEILSISDTQVRGRIDARFDSENNVNGNFTATFCTEE